MFCFVFNANRLLGRFLNSRGDCFGARNPCRSLSAQLYGGAERKRSQVPRDEESERRYFSAAFFLELECEARVKQLALTRECRKGFAFSFRRSKTCASFLFLLCSVRTRDILGTAEPDKRFYLESVIKLFIAWSTPINNTFVRIK